MDLRKIAPFVTLVLFGTAAIAQQRPASPEPAFEVVSVKPSPNDTPEGISLQPDGGVRLTGFRLRTLVTIAYRSEAIQRFDQLVGGPSWIGVDRFDIVAKVGDEPDTQARTPASLPAMLQSLLRDRFRLRIHSETRKMPAYALRMARRDRKHGPELHDSTLDCPSAGATVPPADPERWCGIRAVGGVITGHSVSSSQLAGNLSGYPTIDRHVVDRTGLTGRYDFRLEYSPAFLEPGAAASTGPSLFTALTEQLGLVLQPEKAVLPVLVIDHVEKPTPD